MKRQDPVESLGQGIVGVIRHHPVAVFDVGDLPLCVVVHVGDVSRAGECPAAGRWIVFPGAGLLASTPLPPLYKTFTSACVKAVL